jgi:hypothetical protein
VGGEDLIVVMRRELAGGIPSRIQEVDIVAGGEGQQEQRYPAGADPRG